MSHQNLLLQDDPFAPDSIEHLPSQHCESSVPEIKARLIDAADASTELRKLCKDLRKLCYDACVNISSSEHQSNLADDRIEALERQLAEASKGHAMYEHVRTMSARAFTDLWCASISGGSSFDDLILGDMEKRKGDRA